MNGVKRFAYKVLHRLLYSGRYGDIALRKTLLSQLPEHLECYIDVGAYDGSFFEVIRNEATIGSSLLIEPQEVYYNRLHSRYAADPSVKVIQSVLMSDSRPVSFHINKLSATSSVFAADEKLLGSEIDITGEAVQSQSKTLDQVAGAYAKIDLLKLDVQGAELEVLKGGTATLKRTRLAWIEVSFKPLYKNSPLFHDIQQYMESQGFVMINILPGFRGKSGELLQADCLFKKADA